MARKGKAVIARELGRPVVVEEVAFDPPGRGEVLVKIGAVGVCHSDLSGTNGTIALPLPLILGPAAGGAVGGDGGGGAGGGAPPAGAGDQGAANWFCWGGACHYCNIGRPVLCDQQGKAL